MATADDAGGGVAVLAPIGRDAEALAALIGRAGLRAVLCQTPEGLVETLEGAVEVAVVAEEALYGTHLSTVGQWVASQPPWSDQPFLILTTKNEGPRFGAFRRELVTRLRNVTFLERPLQGITLQATVLSAERARRRQYEGRAYLASQQEAAARLEELVTERTLDLEQANDRLRKEITNRERAQAALLQSQKIESLGQLVGGVAHDFNNLLMAVIGNLDLLGKHIGPEPRLNRLLNGAMEGARRGASLTQRLLAFARKQELQAKATDVSSLVHDMGDLIHRSVGPLVRVDVVAPADLPAVTVDPNQLEMALLNLAVNARDAMPHGGALSIDIRRDEVLEDAQAPLGAGSYVRVAVSDTGEGMDADTLARAVEPFFSTKAVGRGTGLGLSMVFGLAEQSGGALRLESAVGRGTTAHLWLPVAAGNAEKSDSTLTKPEVSSPAAILFVDDDVLVADSSVALLEDLGHSVTRAGSGGEALQILGQGLPLDLMITDYAMPEMTGVELGEAARRLRPGLPILLATGFADLEDAGTTDLPRLAKPYTQGQLAAQIARLLGRRGS
jgi:signal transduction histidine kinase